MKARPTCHEAIRSCGSVDAIGAGLAIVVVTDTDMLGNQL
jgi:hypothetical protein